MKPATEMTASLVGVAAAFTLVLLGTLSGTAPAARGDRGRDGSPGFGFGSVQPAPAVHSYAGCPVPAANDDGLGVTKQRPIGARPGCRAALSGTEDRTSGNRLKPIGTPAASPGGPSHP